MTAEPITDRRPAAKRLFERDPDVSPWLFWPVRLVLLIVVVPLVLLWELAKLARR